jgi:hypothetical protein
VRDIQINLNRLDAEALLPLIVEQSEKEAGTLRSGYLIALHSAITDALDAPDSPEGLP